MNSGLYTCQIKNSSFSKRKDQTIIKNNRWYLFGFQILFYSRLNKRSAPHEWHSLPSGT